MAGLECSLKEYADAGRDPQTNLMIGFDQKDMWGPEGARSSPDLYGASGCGLWRYGRRLRSTTSAPLLSAIAIEWQKKGRQKHILGTRIHVAIGALSEKYPDVQAFVERQIADA